MNGRNDEPNPLKEERGQLFADLKGYGLVFLGVFCFGLTLPFTREIVKEINPHFLGWSRPFFAGLGAMLFLSFTSFGFPKLKDFKKYFLVILGIAWGFPLFSSLSMGKISASHGGVLLALLPIGITTAGVFLSRERPSSAFWACCFIGSGLVIFYSLVQGLGSFQLGDVYLFIAVFLASLGYAWGSVLSQKVNGMRVISWALILALPLNLLPTIHFFPDNFFDLKTSTYIYYAYVVLFSQFGGFFFFYQGAALIGVARSGMLHLLQPFITILVAFAFFEKRVDFFTLLIAALIVLVIYYSKKVPIYKKSESL